MKELEGQDDVGLLAGVRRAATGLAMAGLLVWRAGAEHSLTAEVGYRSLKAVRWLCERSCKRQWKSWSKPPAASSAQLKQDNVAVAGGNPQARCENAARTQRAAGAEQPVQSGTRVDDGEEDDAARGGSACVVGGARDLRAMSMRTFASSIGGNLCRLQQRAHGPVVSLNERRRGEERIPTS